MTATKQHWLFIALFTLTSLFLAGCSTFKEGFDEEVTILSYPSGADVTVGGQFVGKTPLEVSLGKKIGHEILITLYGFKPYITDVLPQLNDKDRGTVQFAFAQESGAYNTLEPNPVLAVLRPENAGMPDPYDAMTALIVVNDQRLDAGHITERMHRDTNNAIMKYFEPRR